MSIRLRLLFSYIAMILVPVLFAVISALLIALLFKGDLKEIRNIYMSPGHHHESSLSKENQLWVSVYRQSIQNPGILQDQSYIKQLDGKLKKFGITLAVRKDHRFLYLSPDLRTLDVEDLPAFGNSGEVDPLTRIDKQLLSLKQMDFYFPDKSEGSLFFVKDASHLVSFVRSFFPWLFISLIVILVLTNGLLTYFVSRSIIRPIKELQKAAAQIKEGNLNNKIAVKSKDELGQLAQGFEEMRFRLKESIELQVAYEDNRKELIANISHDLKTPITTIKGYIEGIRDGVANNPDKMERYLHTIYTKAVDLDHMIDELFLYSKLDLNRVPFHFEPIEFDEYLEDYVEELRFDLEVKEVEITLQIEDNGNYQIMADREQIKRVITNIVDNSLKYMDKEKKRITMLLSTAGSNLLFEMKDNGPGIKEENLPLVFDRFYRADLARGTEKGGSGLGLAIAKRIIEGHKGSIWAESIKGEGTSIFFALKKGGDLNEQDSDY
ncbi:sensor histidine kinase [Heyndrickxia acidicola]|uniref:histidine kinase n=1 Tax=Heyndrickxia acidicola TaxID=209389 RepID=A0ABU6MGR6_9BACI|nr:ATP-binding protein [Heyndrickxia acidicola]MED1203587.1 ATP-binding protein [Heyndrickxia acidicola]